MKVFCKTILIIRSMRKKNFLLHRNATRFICCNSWCNCKLQCKLVPRYSTSSISFGNSFSYNCSPYDCVDWLETCFLIAFLLFRECFHALDDCSIRNKRIQECTFSQLKSTRSTFWCSWSSCMCNLVFFSLCYSRLKINFTNFNFARFTY